MNLDCGLGKWLKEGRKGKGREEKVTNCCQALQRPCKVQGSVIARPDK